MGPFGVGLRGALWNATPFTKIRSRQAFPGRNLLVPKFEQQNPSKPIWNPCLVMIFRKESIGEDPGPPKQVQIRFFQELG